MIQITLPDGSQREFPGPVTVAEVAASIGTGLAKAALAGKVDGKVVDTSYSIGTNSHLSIITREESNFQLLRCKKNSVKKGNEKKKAELEASMSKSAERIVSLKSQVPTKCREFCSVMLSVFGDAYAYDCVLSDAVHADHRLAQQLNDILQSLNSDTRVFIPPRVSPPSLSYEAFVNCFGGLDSVTIGLEPRSITVMSQPLAAVSAHVIASLSNAEGQVSVSRHLLRLADQVASGDWAQWIANTTIDPILVNKTSEAYMMNYAHMSGNLRAKAFVTFMHWCNVYKRLLPGKGNVEVPEFARMRPGDSLEEVESTQANMWDAKLVKAIKEVRFVCYNVSTLSFFIRSLASCEQLRIQQLSLAPSSMFAAQFTNTCAYFASLSEVLQLCLREF